MRGALRDPYQGPFYPYQGPFYPYQGPFYPYQGPSNARKLLIYKAF